MVNRSKEARKTARSLSVGSLSMEVDLARGWVLLPYLEGGGRGDGGGGIREVGRWG